MFYSPPLSPWSYLPLPLCLHNSCSFSINYSKMK